MAFLTIVDEQQEYLVPGTETVLLYERLDSRVRQSLIYLCTERGEFDQSRFQQAAIAVSLRGWRNLHGSNGPIAFPTRDTCEGVSAEYNTLFPTLAPWRQVQLSRVLALVERFPLDILTDFFGKVNALEPDEIKKSSPPLSSAPSDLPTASLGTSSAVPSAVLDAVLTD